MKRRLFLALVLGALAASGARAQGAAAPQQPQQVPPDRITLEEFRALRAEGKVLVLDVRVGVRQKIKGASHIALDELESRLAELPRDREVITYCS